MMIEALFRNGKALQSIEDYYIGYWIPDVRNRYVSSMKT
jgi:hypothetical protein